MSRPEELKDLQPLDARSLRIYREEARSQAAEARIGKALAGNYGGYREERFAMDLEFWEGRQQALEAELDRRGLEYE